MRKRPQEHRNPRFRKIGFAVLSLAMCAGFTLVAVTPNAGATVQAKKFGNLDCNGHSTFESALRASGLCADIKGFANVRNANNWNGRFQDNGHYIGHDEPDLTFTSSQPGSGNNVTWAETVGTDPKAAPTDKSPGHDTTDWFELTPAPWTSMIMCDSDSYPQLPCTPDSDINAPACTDAFNCAQNTYPGGGDAVMEFQLYPPGDAPFADNISCNDKYWCSALTIDSLECTYEYFTCNPACEEPVNFAFIQKNGVPTGPPGPETADLNTETPNKNTLMIAPGDHIQVHEWDAPVPGEKGQKAFEVMVTDTTTKQKGWMQASAANGFGHLSMLNCQQTPYNFEPAYNTAGPKEIGVWAALQTDISTEFETGHDQPCTSLTGASVEEVDGISDETYDTCHGPYQNSIPNGPAGNNDSGPCYKAGDTHYMLHAAPNVLTVCDDFDNGGDLDFDGPSYRQQWPTSPTAGTFPGSFIDSLPTTNGHQYSDFYMQTDIALSEATCGAATPKGCTVPPKGPGGFYPYWSEIDASGTCYFYFGNVSKGVNDFGKDAEYGTNHLSQFGYPEFIGKTYSNVCASK
ncbi:MAG TPA: hypothetical protein VGP46_11465 [Acidimicrobiales bacterium]|jgi:hypothetical protein|nr:hypothetical protein [Acidimicrobiales bacterium]